jgi:hypothetical protein
LCVGNSEKGDKGEERLEHVENCLVDSVSFEDEMELWAYRSKTAVVNSRGFDTPLAGKTRVFVPCWRTSNTVT